MSLLTLVVTLFLAGPAFGADEPFVDLDFDAAAAKAKDAGKLLMVDFTATWCPPCKMMEKQTWPDEKVRAWVAEHAVAIQVDIDTSRELAQKFGFQAIPTIIFLKDGQEVDRHTGFMDVAKLLEMGNDVLAGKSQSATLAERGKALLDSDDAHARYDVARDLLRAGLNDLALQHFLWLWPNTRTASGFGGVRLSFMLSDMARLAQADPPAQTAFSALLDEAQARIDASTQPTFEAWQEWTSLCQHFGERARVVTWYEAHRDENGRLLGETTRGLIPGLVDDEVFEVLLEADRPVDAVRLYPDILARARREVADYRSGIERVDSMPEELRESLQEYQTTKCRDGLATLHAASLAAGQPEPAGEVARQLLSVLDDGESRLVLVRRRLDLAPGDVAELSTWLDEAAAKGADVADLRVRLAAPNAAQTAPPSGG